MFLRNRWVLIFLCSLVLCCCVTSFAFAKDDGSGSVLFSHADWETEPPGATQTAATDFYDLPLASTGVRDYYKSCLLDWAPVDASKYPELSVADKDESNIVEISQTKIEIKESTGMLEDSFPRVHTNKTEVA